MGEADTEYRLVVVAAAGTDILAMLVAQTTQDRDVHMLFV